MHVIIADKELIQKLRKMPDNRTEVKEGDVVYGIWFGDDRWRKFEVERLYPYRNQEETGLGFCSDDKAGVHSVGDIGYAYHIVKLDN